MNKKEYTKIARCSDNCRSNHNRNYLSSQEVKSLVYSVKDIRDKFVIQILYETGCTLGELVNIKVSDIKDSTIRLTNTDSKETRKSRISSSLYKKLLLYIKGNGLKEKSYIISTRNSENISEKRVRQLIQSYGNKLGYPRLNPQLFRYYHIAHAYEKGVFIDNISNQLGIKKFRVFQILTELSVEIKKDTYDNFYNGLEENKDE
jgi:integrase/recombinase XerD